MVGGALLLGGGPLPEDITAVPLALWALSRWALLSALGGRDASETTLGPLSYRMSGVWDSNSSGVHSVVNVRVPFTFDAACMALIRSTVAVNNVRRVVV